MGTKAEAPGGDGDAEEDEDGALLEELDGGGAA